MIAFPILGGILIVFGFMFILLPRQLLKLTSVANTIIPVDQKIFKHRYLVGILMLIASVLMYYISRTLIQTNSVLAITSLVLSVFVLLISAILIFNPRLMEKLNEAGGKIIATDEITLVYRKTSGLFFILAGSYMIYSWMY
ncbi:MAG: hypothetical protein IIB40_01720 [Candidatus Marinimicrobia bacterium]|nr:hypothetical protein [Candidatus Neomarinimicrobiota bacterium]